MPPRRNTATRRSPISEYCWELSDLYQRYIGGGESAAGTLVRRPDPEGRYAVDKCQQGDTATAIPILERKLLANRFTLPWR